MAPFPRQLGCSLLDTPRADSVGHLHCLAPSPSSLSQGCDGEGSSNGNGGARQSPSCTVVCPSPLSPCVTVLGMAIQDRGPAFTGHGHPGLWPHLHWARPSRTVAPPSLGTAIQDRGPAFSHQSTQFQLPRGLIGDRDFTWRAQHTAEPPTPSGVMGVVTVKAMITGSTQLSAPHVTPRLLFFVPSAARSREAPGPHWTQNAQ